MFVSVVDPLFVSKVWLREVVAGATAPSKRRDRCKLNARGDSKIAKRAATIGA